MFRTRFEGKWLPFFGMALVLSSATACGSDAAPSDSSGAAMAASNPLTGQAGASDKGCQTYAVECAACHGSTGGGDGIHGKHLTPAPSDLRRATLAKSDEQLYQRIWNGGAMPPFNSGMPAYKDLLSADQIWQVLVYLRALASNDARACSAPAGAGASGGAGGMSSSLAGHGGGAQHDPAAGAGGATGMSASGTSGASGSAAAGGMSGAGAVSGTGGFSGATGGSSGAAGTTGGAGGGSEPIGPVASQACLDWCGCLQMECAELSAYPFDSEAMCQARCEALGADELSCWTDQCMEAASSQEALREHHCEHGWGAHGLEEC